MNDFSRRGRIRLLSYLSASAAALIVMTAVTAAERDQYRRELEFTYQRALQDAVSLVSDISLSLDKGLHAGTGVQMAALSASLRRDAGAAKSALASLPLSDYDLGGAYKFLSQVGDYAMSLSKKVQSGQTVTDGEEKSLYALRDYAAALERQLSGVQARASAQGAGFMEAVARAPSQPDGEGARADIPENGFLEMEESFSAYPTLIYDGPFSDHLLEKAPELTRGASPITREEARAVAAMGAMLPPERLEDGADEMSRMPSYTFTAGDGVSAAVTKDGGYLVYMADGRLPSAAAISIDEARERAMTYLAAIGLGQLQETYYETSGNILTINYAFQDGGVIYYPDLVKVGVALDNGGIVLFDARGYIMNHKDRGLGTPSLSAEKAAQSLSAELRAGTPRLALIPTAGRNEALCYEFHAVDANGEEFLVYINAATGAEEQILRLIIREGGVLTR